MEHPEDQKFTLEDILREFSDHPQTPPAPPAPPEEPVRPDTIRLDEIQEAVANSPQFAGDTEEYAPVDEPPVEEEAATRTIPMEPFTEAWEPEYDEQVWEFTPTTPEPTQLPDKNKMRRLRRDIVAGPEKRFHDLDEKGKIKLRLSGIINTLLLLVMTATVLCFHFGLLGPERLRLVVYVQFVGLLLSMLLGCYRMLEGLHDILRRRFTPNTLLAVTAVVMLVDSVLCFQEQRISLAAVFVLEMSMAIWAADLRRKTELDQMDTLRRASELHAVVRVPDYWEGKPGYLKAEGKIGDFMEGYLEPTGPEKVIGWFSLGVLVAGIAVGITGGVLQGLSGGVQAGSAALLLGLPATVFICAYRPMALLGKRLHKLGSVICGWKGMKAVDKYAAYPLTDEDLFPSGSVKLNGTKFYNEHSPDEVVAYTAALMNENGGTMAEVFARMLDSRNGYRFTVEQFSRYSGGVGGNFGDVSVLVGSRQFLQEMGVDMGKAAQLQRAVYTAVDGTLAGVFALQYQKSKDTSAGLRTLSGYKGLQPLVMTEDFMLTEQAIAERFRVHTRGMRFLLREEYEPLLQRQAQPEDPVVALTTRDNLSARAHTITGARVLKSALKAGMVTHITGGVLGIGVVVLLAVTGAMSLITPVNVLLYQLVWMIPGLLITEWTRSL